MNQVEDGQASDRNGPAKPFLPPGQDHSGADPNREEHQAEPLSRLDLGRVEAFTHKERENQSDARHRPDSRAPSDRPRQHRSTVRLVFHLLTHASVAFRSTYELSAQHWS